MKDEFTNRLGAFRTTLDFLQAPANKVKWDGQPPLRFGSRVAEAVTALAALAEFCQQQGAVITGAAVDKAREEQELEDAAFVLGQAVAWATRRTPPAARLPKAPGVACGTPRCWRTPGRSSALPAHCWRARTPPPQRNAASPPPAWPPAPRRRTTTRRSSAPRSRPSREERPPPASCATASMRSRPSLPALTAWWSKFADQTFVASYYAARIVRDLGHGPGADTPPVPAP